MKDRPLAGIRIVEFAAIGPGPFCGMLLSDLGADVVRIDRPGAAQLAVGPITGRGRRSVALDLKTDKGRETALALLGKAEACFEGYRPGVMERMGLGPDVALARNPALVYGRMTGWGQHGPLAEAAGHDLNYIALTGALGAMGRPGEPPAPPLNLVGDYGGGAMFLAFGLLAGIIRARASGEGQVIDAAMTDGAALLTAMFHDMMGMGMWQDRRGVNLLDGGAPFYGVYECADGGYVAIGALEPQFYAELLERTGLAGDPVFAEQMDPGKWPAMRERLAEVFRGRTREEWCAAMEGSEACFAPVLSLTEAPEHPHNIARGTFIKHQGMVQPGTAPRFRGAPNAPAGPAPEAGEHNRTVLKEWLGTESG